MESRTLSTRQGRWGRLTKLAFSKVVCWTILLRCGFVEMFAANAWFSCLRTECLPITTIPGFPCTRMVRGALAVLRLVPFFWFTCCAPACSFVLLGRSLTLREDCLYKQSSCSSLASSYRFYLITRNLSAWFQDRHHNICRLRRCGAPSASMQTGNLVAAHLYCPICL